MVLTSVSPDSPAPRGSAGRCVLRLRHSLCQQGWFYKSGSLRTARQEVRVIQIQMGNRVFAGLSPELQPSCKDKYVAEEELLPLNRLGGLCTKRYHTIPVTVVPSDWRLRHHSGWKTKRFSAKNLQRCCALAGQLFLFFFDLSSMPLFFPTPTIKHFPLTLCRALLKKSLV